ncbi:MAG: DNA repair protein RecO [Polyangiaceae bacterium]
MNVIETAALLARRVDTKESDLVVTLLTEAEGKVAAIVRGAKRSTKRFGGALEPLHTIHVVLEDSGRDLAFLKEASLRTIRTGILGRLDALDAAGVALRWARQLFPARTREPDAFRTVENLLDVLERGDTKPKHALAAAALRLLSDVGYGLDLERCVRCGRPCPEDRPACIDAATGGLVCTACGGSRTVLSPELRRVARAFVGGESVPVDDEGAATLLRIAEAAMAVHAEVAS